MTMRTRHLVALTGAAAAALGWLVAVPRSTDAYTVSTIITEGCHEMLTTDALRAVRSDPLLAAPIALTRDEQALVDDLEFTPPSDMKDLGGATLLVGARDNDLKGRASDDLSQMAGVHGNPDNQDEHCLRSKEQDEPGGSAAAIAACRVFIRGRILEALDGLDAGGVPDPSKRTSLPLHLALRGRVDASLPTYYVRMGQALHGVEDSFTHTYRTADQMQITVALNWIDESNGTYRESRDGPAHSSKLDACTHLDSLRAEKRRLATEASIAFLRATLDPLKTKDEKMATVDGLLDTYLSYSPGCTYGNNWCDAPEKQYKDPGKTFLGCSSGGDGLLAAIGALLGLTLLPRRRRSIASTVAGLVIVGAVALPAGGPRAAEPSQPPAEEPAETDKHEPPPPVTQPVAQPGPHDPSKGAWGGYLGISGSADKPALAVQLGLRRRVSTHWTFGWDAEWNPWVTAYGPKTIRPGVFNTYGTAILRFPLAYENFNLRTTVSLGFSDLLFDLYGAPKGSIGLYGAISPLGLEWKLSRAFLLIINPLSISIPAPQLRGIPLTYPQYRTSIGLGVLAG
jgi:hypothetical protein